MKKFAAFLFVFIIAVSTAVSCSHADTRNNDTTPETPEIQQPTCTEDTKSETTSGDTVSEFIPNYTTLGYRIKTGRIEVQSQNVIFDKFDTSFDDPQTWGMTVERLNFGDTELYDENFFENSAVLKIMFSSSYAGYSYYVSHIHIDEGSITFGISRTVQAPDTLMNDMGSGKVLLVEMEKSKIEGIDEFYAVDTTNHKTFFANVSKGPRSGFSMDMNSKEYAMTCYTPTKGGNYDELYLKGGYRLDGETLAFLVSNDGSQKFVFDVTDDGFVFNERKSEWDANYIVPLTFPDGTVFK